MKFFRKNTLIFPQVYVAIQFYNIDTYLRKLRRNEFYNTGPWLRVQENVFTWTNLKLSLAEMSIARLGVGRMICVNNIKKHYKLPRNSWKS